MPDDLTTRRETRELPLQLRFAPVANVDAKARTVDVVWTTGAAVRRYDWRMDRYYLEELSLEPGAIRMARLASGSAPFLDSHGAWELRKILGVVERAWVERGEHLARVRFSKRDEVEPVFQDVRDGILKNVSVGYHIHHIEMIPPADDNSDWVYRAVDWEPHELSLVAIGADAGAGTRSERDERGDGRPHFPCEFSEETRTMPDNAHGTGTAASESPSAVRAERVRVAEITRRVRDANLPQLFADDLIERGVAVDTACRAIVDEIARLRPAPPTVPYVTTEARDGGPARVVEDMASALHARYGGPAPSEAARRFVSYRVVDLARDLLEMGGVSTRGLSRDELLARGFHSTSDFPNLLENVANKVLLQGYQAAPPGTKVIARQVLARDFRAMPRVQFGEAPTLLKVLEGGEFKRGKMADSKESYSVETYGRVIGVSRQALVNDDLGGFTTMARKFGQSAAEFESSQITGLLTANGTMNDGGALFNATAVTTTGGHANLATGTGSALSATSLATGVKAMRLQKGLDAVTPINVTPKFLIVPAALEYTALQLVSMITPASASDVNPHSGRYEVIVDARLDGASTTAWYLAADPAVIDGLEYAYLEDAPGVQLFTEEGWDRDGIEWKARLDFGCGAVEFKGLYKGAGV
jgi:hypothetical protein